jgi:hypothetical protein
MVRKRCSSLNQTTDFVLKLQALRCQRSQPKVADRMSVICSAEAQASVDTPKVDLDNLKRGVAHYNGIRGSAYKVSTTLPIPFPTALVPDSVHESSPKTIAEESGDFDLCCGSTLQTSTRKSEREIQDFNQTMDAHQIVHPRDLFPSIYGADVTPTFIDYFSFNKVVQYSVAHTLVLLLASVPGCPDSRPDRQNLKCRPCGICTTLAFLFLAFIMQGSHAAHHDLSYMTGHRN